MHPSERESEPADVPHVLLVLLDARVHRDRARPGARGVITFGVRSARFVHWWTCTLSDESARTTFGRSKPAQYDVAVGLDEDGADALLGRCQWGMKLVAGDRVLLARFAERYLTDVSPVEARARQQR